MEFEAHPATRVPYTFRPETQRKNKTPMENQAEEAGEGYKVHKVRARRRLSPGAAIKGRRLIEVGLACSFTKSFITSAKG